MPTIPQDTGIALAVVAAFISNFLRSDGLARWQNMLLAGVSFLILSCAAMWLIGGFSGSLRDMALYFISIAVVLGCSELRSLVRYLQEAPSPLAPEPPRETAEQ